MKCMHMISRDSNHSEGRGLGGQRQFESYLKIRPFWYTVLQSGMTTRALLNLCLVLIFLNSIVHKTHTLNPEVALLYQFHAEKPEVCSVMNFRIDNDPPAPP